MPDGDKSSSLVKVSDLLGVGAAAKVLAHVVVKGVGPLLEPWQRRRINKAEVQNAEDWLQLAGRYGGDLDQISASLGGRAEIRTSTDQRRYQLNREAIARLAIDEFQSLPDAETIVTPETPPDDWVDAYWTLAERVTKEQMQQVWARLLLNKTVKALPYSPRLLNFVSLMDGAEIAAVENIAPFVAASDFEGRSTYFVPIDWRLSARADDAPLRDLNNKLRAVAGDRADDLLGPIGVYVESGWAYSINYPADRPFIDFEFQGYHLRVTPVPDVDLAKSKATLIGIGGGIQLSSLGFQVARLCYKSERTRAFLDVTSQALAMCGFEARVEER